MRVIQFAVLLPVLMMMSWSLTAAEVGSPCEAPEYRQFDFWVGEWNVFDAAGEKLGENVIAVTQGGCALHERWAGAKGGTGESFNMYDAPREVWHQTWVAASGQLLLLEGGLNDDGEMVLAGSRPQRDGKGNVMDRISWIPKEDGSVHQVWEQSLDAGRTWETVFLGVYRKKK